MPQYYPLTFTSLWVEYQLWGLQPLGYHLVNILLHALNACCSGGCCAGCGVPGAWVAAAIFALHPMMVESVAWITERKNVLSGTVRSRRAAGLSARRGGAGGAASHWRSLAPLCASLFVAARCLSKTVTCSLPAVLLLLEWWKRGGLERRTCGGWRRCSSSAWAWQR